MLEEKIIGRKDGAVAEIIFNNPAKHNATSLEMWQRVGELASGYADDDDVRILIVSGAGGKAFVSGADISEFESTRATTESAAAYNAISGAAYKALYTFPKPTIAKIRGFCLGGGVNLAACCDLRIAAEGSRFGVPAAKLGLGYGYEPVRRLAEIVSLPRALEMLYTARQLSAEEAASIGLVSRLVPATELDATVADCAEAIAANAPLTIALVKAAARELAKPSAERDFEKLRRMSDACTRSRDYAEGRAAFLEKRKPRFEGR